MTSDEVANLYRITARTAKLAGEIAEVGVHGGGSAFVIAIANRGERPMHLFDTFNGIPEVTPGIDLVPVGYLKKSIKDAKELL